MTIFGDEHDMFREAFRTFVEREFVPHREKWEQDGIVDREVFTKAGAAGFLAMAVPEEYGGAGVSDFRYWLIIIEELCRADVYPARHGPDAPQRRLPAVLPRLQQRRAEGALAARHRVG